MSKYEPNRIPLHVRGENPDMMIPKTPEPEEEPQPWKKTSVVGTSMSRVDAYERVSGSAQYTYDVYRPGMLYAAVLYSPYAHARVKSIDTSAAESMPGVHAVISSKTPAADLDFHGGRTRVFDTTVRHNGDEVAAVAAESPHLARQALKAITVEYEELPFVLTKEEATAPDAPQILPVDPDGGRRSVGKNNAVRDPGGMYSRGNVEQALQNSDAVAELTFHNACVIHTPLEVHGCVAQWDGSKLRVWDSTQGVFNMKSGIARSLQLPGINVDVIGDYVGGGFGAKLGIWKHHIIAAVLAKLSARPVKLMIDREASFVAAGNRPLTDATLTGGVRKDGTITAIRHIGSSTGGAFPYTNTTGFQSTELYLCENVEQQEEFYLSNTALGCAMRAPGFPNGSFMLEQLMDELAHRIEMDPVQFRVKNVPTFSQNDDSNRPYTSTGLADCLTKGAEAFGWEEARKQPKGDGHIKRGVGVAGGMWAYGGGWPPATVMCKAFADGSVSIITGASDIGTGTKTILTMIVAEELGMPVERVRIDNADTGHTPWASASGGSKTLPTEGPAARNAAFELKKILISLAADHLKVPTEDLSLANEEIVSSTDPQKKITVSNLLQQTQRFDVVGVGYRAPNTNEKIIRTFGAHFAEVEVNTLTGKLTIKRLIAANESGRVINRLTFNNQVIGGMTMAVGQGLTEERIMDAGQTGKMVNRSWLDYKVPTSMEMPIDQEVVAVEPNDTECNNTGAKGLGEPAMIPTMGAIANAFYNATGVRITKTPITPVEIVKALAANRKRG